MNRTPLRAALLAFSIASVTVVGCSDEGSEQREQIDAHLSEWRGKKPATYVVVSCSTGAVVGCVRAAVEGDRVKAAQTGTPLADVDPAKVKEPLTGMFEQTSRSLEGSDCELRTLAFDPTYGYLSSYYFDCGQEGWGGKVECFAPNTLDLAACPRQ